MRSRGCNLIGIALLAVGATAVAQDPSRRCLDFPDTADGRRVLTVDLHTHSVFSDGHVWPSIRVWEAQRDCLDAMAVTEHLEYQPHWNDIPHPDRNRSFRLATRLAAGGGPPVLILPGAEITRNFPPGHINAIFIEDANSLNFPRGEGGAARVEDSRRALAAAGAQGAFLFWNHSFWTRDYPNGVVEMTAFHRRLIADDLLHGIEVANGQDYSEEAFQIALDHNLTVLGVSDVHGLVDWDYDIAGGGHRTASLVLTADSSADGIEAALRARASVAVFKQTLIGRQAEMDAILASVLSLETGEYRNNSTLLPVTLRNRAPIDLLLRNVGEKMFTTSGDVFRIPARSRYEVVVKNVADADRLELTFEVLSAFVRPRIHPAMTLRPSGAANPW